MIWASFLTAAAYLSAAALLFVGVKYMLASFGAGFAAQGDRLKQVGHRCLIWAAIMLLATGLIG
ncbi:hypothetical protein [Mesobacterium pallidum]|uniref:hypothetical protein n=1 Tax=Mesobacterium pallidum TaxID=2872037 RepID=UPI001EE30A35|nr:hypothetical protein [Mesobacterium pallidum]